AREGGGAGRFVALTALQLRLAGERLGMKAGGGSKQLLVPQALRQRELPGGVGRLTLTLEKLRQLAFQGYGFLVLAGPLGRRVAPARGFRAQFMAPLDG